MIRVEWQGSGDTKCEKFYEGCKGRIMFSEKERKVLCFNGEFKITE